MSASGWASVSDGKLGPASEDATAVKLLQMVDVNADGNLDLVYSADGELTRVVLGQSVEQTFDAAAVEKYSKRDLKVPT